MKYVRFVAIAIQVLLYILTAGLAVIWFFEINAPFDVEAATFILLGLVSPLMSYTIKRYTDKIKYEKFSTANALAYGYIENFVEPVVTQLLKNGNNPTMYIFLPERLSDLYPKNIDRLKAGLLRDNYKISSKSIKINEGRIFRDVMTVASASTDVYFDIPNTLLTLRPLIDFRTNSPTNDLCEKEKEELGSIYISKFKETINKLVNNKGLKDHVKLIDKTLQFG